MVSWEPATLQEQAAGLVMPGFRFGTDEPEAAERLVDMGVGGFCLYFGAPAEVAGLTRRLQERARRPLVFSADYEDGSAQHVAGGTALPSNMGIAAAGDPALAGLKARVTAAEAWAMGVRWVLAPVLDLATEPANPIVNTRAFGSDPAAVAKFAKAYCRGLSEAGALSCIKHFPGHGETKTDSHLDLPVLKRTRAQLLAEEVKPFQALASVADTAMMAHLSIPGLGERGPSSLSPKAVALLRKTLGFKRLVTTDALSMQAIAQRFTDDAACVAALTAGVDVMLVPADPVKAVHGFLRRLEEEPALSKLVEAAHRRLEAARAQCRLHEDRGIAAPELLAQVGSAANRAAAEKLAGACLTWARLEPRDLPLPRKVRYLEPDAERPDEWQGRAFVEELRAKGVSVEPYAPSAEGRLIVGCFLSPRAYTGRIKFSPEEVRPAQAALASDDRSVLVSFGSPFVFDGFKGWRTGLCAFSPSEHAQRAAARALLAMQDAPGKMPVPLKSLKPRR